MQHLILASEIPKAYSTPKSLQPDDVDYGAFCRLAEIKDGVVDFVRHGKSLYVCGERTGTGKTSWATKIMLKYFDGVWAGNGFRTRGLFVHVPTVLLKFKNFQNPVSEEYKRDMMECDLVVWDDVAGTGVSNYDATQMLTYIDCRVANGLSNLYTGNVTSRETLERALGSRVASRVWVGSEVITINGNGGDKR